MYIPKAFLPTYIHTYGLMYVGTEHNINIM